MQDGGHLCRNWVCARRPQGQWGALWGMSFVTGNRLPGVWGVGLGGVWGGSGNPGLSTMCTSILSPRGTFLISPNANSNRVL